MSLRPRARIHLSNIVSNWRRINDMSGYDGAGAVVKANAYGHGASKVSSALAKAGCRHFFVAYGFEGGEVRRAVGLDSHIYVFNGLQAVSQEEIRTSSLIPVLNNLNDIGEWKAGDQASPFALHFDTGMNRLGIPLADVGAVIEILSGATPSLIMTHFACADEPASEMNREQIEAFRTVVATFPGAPVSVSNSAGLWLEPDMRPGLTRPGIALYGGGNSPLRPGNLLPGMTLEAPILQVQQVPAGKSVGYGASYRASAARTIATVGIGYGDGLLRSASNSGFACLGGVRCPLVGRVSMDLVTVDVTAVEPLAKPGAWVELLGAQTDLEEQARAAGTLGYELVTGLGTRVERIYEE